MSLFRAFFFKYHLNRFQWYRRWYGGRWEYHFIDVCHCHMWLDMRSDRCWPAWRQPCSVGAPIVEDYPSAPTGQDQGGGAVNKKYLTPNLWDAFKEDCPIISRMPVLQHWAFGHWVRGYFDAKQPERKS